MKKKSVILSILLCLLSSAVFASNVADKAENDYLYLQTERTACQIENSVLIRTRIEKVEFFIPLRQGLKKYAKASDSRLEVNKSTDEAKDLVSRNLDRTKTIVFPYQNLHHYISYNNDNKPESFVIIDRDTINEKTNLTIDILAFMAANNAKSTYSLFGWRGVITGFNLDFIFDGTEAMGIDNLKEFGSMFSQDITKKKTGKLIGASKLEEEYKVIGFSYITKEEMKKLKKKK